MSHSKDRSLNDISLEYTYEELKQAGTIANEMDVMSGQFFKPNHER